LNNSCPRLVFEYIFLLLYYYIVISLYQGILYDVTMTIPRFFRLSSSFRPQAFLDQRSTVRGSEDFRTIYIVTLYSAQRGCLDSIDRIITKKIRRPTEEKRSKKWPMSEACSRE
jgi:hypothetical protein